MLLTNTSLLFIELGRKYLLNKQKKKKKRLWQREIFKRVHEFGAYHTMFNELRLGDREYFFRYSSYIHFMLINYSLVGNCRGGG